MGSDQVLTLERVGFHAGRKPWRTLGSRKLVALGEVELYEDKLVAGSNLQNKHLRLMLNDFSVIVPLLSGHRLIFEWNYRHALGGWELELPAGLIEDGEKPVESARRELAEETGYTATSWKKLGWVYTLPGITAQRAHIFLARRLRSGRPHPEPVEMMKVENLPVTKAYRLLRDGRIVHAPTVVALSFAETELRRL